MCNYSNCSTNHAQPDAKCFRSADWSSYSDEFPRGCGELDEKHSSDDISDGLEDRLKCTWEGGIFKLLCWECIYAYISHADKKQNKEEHQDSVHVFLLVCKICYEWEGKGSGSHKADDNPEFSPSVREEGDSLD